MGDGNLNIVQDYQILALTHSVTECGKCFKGFKVIQSGDPDAEVSLVDGFAEFFDLIEREQPNYGIVVITDVQRVPNVRKVVETSHKSLLVQDGVQHWTKLIKGVVYIVTDVDLASKSEYRISEGEGIALLVDYSFPNARKLSKIYELGAGTSPWLLYKTSRADEFKPRRYTNNKKDRTTAAQSEELTTV